ncbi:MAG: HDOD domain-containing protein [Deltaproteobacteria bacterium]|nr:HDOD domain-containing protein [Deltaproteobacteria bacterium]
MSKSQQIKAITKKIQSLPTLPVVVQRLTKMVESPDVTAKDVGKLISADQVLTARVLRLVNSPFYGFPGRISSISHAVILLGFNVIKGVVLSASVFDLMEKSMLGLWEHSLGCAVVAGTISRSLGIPEPEEISTAALLHDIGKVVVSVSLREDYDTILRIVDKDKSLFKDAELNLLGTDHSEIGAWLSDEWNLPERLAIPIEYHHRPDEAIKLKERVYVVHIADSIVRAFGIGSGGDPWVQKISQGAWDHLDMGGLDLNELMKEIAVDLEDVENFRLASME